MNHECVALKTTAEVWHKVFNRSFKPTEKPSEYPTEKKNRLATWII
jgi:hypothetical protein